MNILVTICGRAGSKGVGNKNFREFLGRPMISYTKNKFSFNAILLAISLSLFKQISTSIFLFFSLNNFAAFIV